MRYVHGGNIYDKEVELDFSVNVNPLGMPEPVRRAAVEAIKDCGTYPDYDSRRLKRALAEEYGLTAENYICGNGAAGVLYDLVRTLQPRKGMIFVPAFQEYAKALMACGARVCRAELSEKEDFALGQEQIRKVYQEKPEIIFICNPNNPTGKIVERDILDGLLQAAADIGAWLVVDECFLGFTGEESLASQIVVYDRLFLLNAFTKLYAIPGLRCGYGICGNRELLQRMEKARQSWNISQVSEAAAVAALTQKEYVTKTRMVVPQWREKLKKGLNQCGIKVYDSRANFLLLYSERNLYRECLAEKILIRDCSNFEGLREGFFRTAVRTPGENERLLQVIRENRHG